MTKKMTPAQTVAGFAATLAFCFIGTAIVWKWPGSSTWLLWTTLLLVAIFLFFVYRSARKAKPTD